MVFPAEFLIDYWKRKGLTNAIGCDPPGPPALSLGSYGFKSAFILLVCVFSGYPTAKYINEYGSLHHCRYVAIANFFFREFSVIS
jgi:hypothetical protein